MSGAHTARILHASAVAVGQRGLLIMGASGSGKSTLALSLIALGATLIADDRVTVTPGPEGLDLRAPDAILGRIEARGLGLLEVPATSARAFAAIDLDATETARLPEAQEIVIEGVTLPLIRRVESPAFAPMLLLYLRSGRLTP